MACSPLGSASEKKPRSGTFPAWQRLKLRRATAAEAAPPPSRQAPVHCGAGRNECTCLAAGGASGACWSEACMFCGGHPGAFKPRRTERVPAPLREERTRVSNGGMRRQCGAAAAMKTQRAAAAGSLKFAACCIASPWIPTSIAVCLQLQSCSCSATVKRKQVSHEQPALHRSAGIHNRSTAGHGAPRMHRAGADCNLRVGGHRAAVQAQEIHRSRLCRRR